MNWEKYKHCISKLKPGDKLIIGGHIYIFSNFAFKSNKSLLYSIWVSYPGFLSNRYLVTRPIYLK